MVAVRDPAKRVQKYRRPETWKPDLAHLNEVRWPKALDYAELPARWLALDLKLWVFLVLHSDIDRMWGEQTIHIRDIKKWSGATKSQIMESMGRLTEDWIKINTTNAGRFAGVTQESQTFRVLTAVHLSGQLLCWTFRPQMITMLTDTSDGYGRLHVEAIRRLKSYASLRLYQIACVTVHSHAKQESLVWQPDELVRFLGGKGAMPPSNLRRFVDGTMAGIRYVGAFRCNTNLIKYRRDRGLGAKRGRPIETIAFRWSKNDTEAHRARMRGAEIDAAAKRAEEARQGLERNPPPPTLLTEQQIFQQKRDADELRERRRAEWEWKKELAVRDRQAMEVRRMEGELYEEAMGS